MKKALLSFLVILLFTFVGYGSGVQTSSSKDNPTVTANVKIEINLEKQTTKWYFDKDVDVMTDKVNFWYAASPMVKPLESVAIPYKNIAAAVFVRYDNKQLVAGIAFNMYPPLFGGSTNDKSDDGVYFVTKIRWDNKQPEEVKFFMPLLSKYILFDSKVTKDVINKLMTHNTLIVEFDWLLWGVKHFKFPLDGAKEVISELLKQVKN
ncbi:MAG: hypothetical protein ACK4E1_07190 [Fervidobacterium nodosum]